MTYLIKIKTFIFIFIFIFLIFNKATSFEDKIIFKIDNEIITTFDLSQEFKYLTLVNPQIINLENSKIIEISQNSVIREKIKKIEILNHIDGINLDEGYVSQLIKNTYLRIGINSAKDFNNKLIEIGLDLDEIKEKMSIEALWNELIFTKFKSKVKIDKSKLKTQVLSKKQQSSFKLSEIVFNISDSENLNKKYELIKNDIETKGFDNAVLIHSISDTKNTNGDLGWIDENSINKKLLNKILKLTIGNYTQPQVIPGGFLILKLNNVKKNEVDIDADKEIQKLIRLKTNQQLNQFSTIYFNKIKKNIKIEKI